METVYLVSILLAVLCLKVAYSFLGSGRAKDKQSLKDRVRAARSAGQFVVLKQAAVQQEQQQQRHVVVIGASTFLGRAVVEALASSTPTPRVTAFDFFITPDPELPPAVSFVQGDVTNKSHVARLLQGAHVVVCLSTRGRGPLGDDLVPFQAIQGLIEVCLDLDVGHLVYSSTIASITRRVASEQRLADNSPCPTSFTSPEAATRAYAEQLVLAANSHVLQSLVLRVGHVFGRGDQGLADACLAGGILGQAGNNYVPLVWVEDAARAHVLAVQKMLFPDPTATVRWAPALNINGICGPDPPTFKVFVGQASAKGDAPGRSCWGKPRTSSMVPVWAVEILAGIGALGSSKEAVWQWFKASVRVEPDGAQGQLGWQPTPWQAACRRVADDGTGVVSRKAQGRRTKHD